MPAAVVECPMDSLRYDDTAHVVDLKSGKSLTTLRGHSGCINSLTFSPDRSKIVTASMDGLAIVWNISSPGFAVGATVESRAVAEIDLKFPDKPPCITAGSEWFKGVLGNIRDEGYALRVFHSVLALRCNIATL